MKAFKLIYLGVRVLLKRLNTVEMTQENILRKPKELACNGDMMKEDRQQSRVIVYQPVQNTENAASTRQNCAECTLTIYPLFPLKCCFHNLQNWWFIVFHTFLLTFIVMKSIKTNCLSICMTNITHDIQWTLSPLHIMGLCGKLNPVWRCRRAINTFADTSVPYC